MSRTFAAFWWLYVTLIEDNYLTCYLMFRTSIPGPISSVTSNFNIPKVISHGAPTPGLGRVLYRTCLNIALINLFNYNFSQFCRSTKQWTCCLEPFYFSIFRCTLFAAFSCIVCYEASSGIKLVHIFSINFQVTITFHAIWLVKWRLLKWIAIMDDDIGKFM